MSMKSFKHTVSTYSPEICIGVGIVSFIASAVMAAWATPKAQKAHQENEEIKETMDEALEKGETASDELDENGNSVMIPYSDEDYKDDMKLYIGKKIVNETKPYLPAIGFVVAGTALILTGTGILKKRNAAVTALLASTTSMFETYRGRVIADQGKDKDREYYTGVKKITEKVVVTDAKGKDKTVEVEKSVLDESTDGCPLLSPYAVKITAENCRNFESLCGDPVYVGHWLETNQSMMNTHLHTDGILYLDWVLEQMGITLDPELNPTLNSVIAHNVGWIDTDYYYDPINKIVSENQGDRYVDFGCWNDDGSLSLIRGADGAVYLDFNVDGWINGRIPKKSPNHILTAVRQYPEIER